MLDLDLALEDGQLRFYHGSAALLDAQELIAKLSSMIDAAARRAEEEAKRAEEEAKRAEEEAKRAEEEAVRAEQAERRADQEARRAERYLALLRDAGIDPESATSED